MHRADLPMAEGELRAAISKLANGLYIPIFAQSVKYTSASASFEENLYALLAEQSRLTFEKRVIRRLKAAGFPYVKTMDMFAMAADRLPNLDFEEVRRLATCKFIDEKSDVCAIGPSGHGKSHLALAIGNEAVRRGYSVKYRRACDLINEMKEAKSEKRLADYARMMTRCSLLIIDEVGYLNYDEVASSLLYQIVGARYEIGSTFYTSNHKFSEWPDFIGNNALANAIVTRIAHHSIVLDMNGPKAWRLEHARSKRGKAALGAIPVDGNGDTSAI